VEDPGRKWTVFGGTRKAAAHMRKLTRHIEQILYSVNDVATMIGFSRSKTYEMIREGIIPYTVIAGRSSLSSWL